MMGTQSSADIGVIDLYKVHFWLFVAASSLVLVPIIAQTARRWALALVNLAFITLLLGIDTPLVLTGVLVTWLMLKASAGERGSLPAGLLVAGVLLLFLIHKRPGDAAALGLSGINPILAAIGFSYVALRLTDLLRAVCERRHSAPSLPATINYLLPFHSLAAGPIQAYDEFVAQPPVAPAPTSAVALEAVDRIAGGLFKKFVLAFVVERVFLTGFRARGPYFLLEVQWHYLWLYLDFSAYSDIAVGIGNLIGVATPENFNRPYLAQHDRLLGTVAHLAVAVHPSKPFHSHPARAGPPKRGAVSPGDRVLRLHRILPALRTLAQRQSELAGLGGHPRRRPGRLQHLPAPAPAAPGPQRSQPLPGEPLDPPAGDRLDVRIRCLFTRSSRLPATRSIPMSQSATLIEDGAAARVGPLILRVLWIALRIFAVLCLGQPGERFFYQGF